MAEARTYRILLADDEPIILSGLQSMLRWEEYGCAVAGTARNGEQALEFIRQYRPDIVICDINMPLLTGLELLGRCAEEIPETVFVMLTNYENFDMARESMRNRAVDYLLKIDLDEQKLAQSVERAVGECEKRGRLARTEPPEGAIPADAIRRYVAELLTGEDSEAAAAGLKTQGVADACAVAELIMDPSSIPNIATFTPEERERLFTFHHRLVEDLAQKLFHGVGHVVLPRGSGAWLYLWNLENSELLPRFHAKLTATLGEISQMRLSILITDTLPAERLGELRLQFAALHAEFTLSPRSVLRYDQVTAHTDYVEAAKQYIECHILERFSVQDAAAAIGITPNYLSSLFKRQLGQNFIDFVNARKVQHACILLRDGRHLVYEVSHMLGYDNAYYFTKVFKRYRGVTPSEYQNLSSHVGEESGKAEGSDIEINVI